MKVLSRRRVGVVAALLVLASGVPVWAAGGFLEDFEDGSIADWTAVAPLPVTANVLAAAAHDGAYGLQMDNLGQGWVYRDDAAVQVGQGQTVSVWARFDGVADGRAYFGFGASAAGTLSLVLAPNSGELLFQENAGYGFLDIGSSSQAYQADRWYRMEVVWAVGGGLTGNLYDSDGVTLLGTVGASSTLYAAGGFALRGFSDSTGTVSFDSFMVPAPDVTCTAARGLLYPARGALLGVGLSHSATDDTDPDPMFVGLEVWSDEPDGPAPFSPDTGWTEADLLLRADRSATGDGRVYLVAVFYENDAGGVGHGCCTVVVPKLATVASLTSVQGQAAAAEAACAAGAPPGGYVQLLEVEFGGT